MRYIVGQEIPVIGFVFKEMPHDPFAPSRWDHPRIGMGLPDIRLEKLTVKEHHVVEIGKAPAFNFVKSFPDPKKKDGYILENDDGKIFTNQYPEASFDPNPREDYVFKQTSDVPVECDYFSLAAYLTDLEETIPMLVCRVAHGHLYLAPEKDAAQLEMCLTLKKQIRDLVRTQMGLEFTLQRGPQEGSSTWGVMTCLFTPA